MSLMSPMSHVMCPVVTCQVYFFLRTENNLKVHTNAVNASVKNIPLKDQYSAQLATDFISSDSIFCQVQSGPPSSKTQCL